MNLIDRAVLYLSPKIGGHRLKNRLRAEVFAKNSEAIREEMRKFDAATKGRRGVGWDAKSNSANAELEASLSWLRNRSRDLVRNNQYGKRTINLLQNNIIGTGIVPAIIGESDAGKAAAEKIKKIWKKWAESIKSDFEEHMTFYALQGLVVRTIAESGEALILRRREAGRDVPFSLQVLEPDYIDSMKTVAKMEGGGYINQGIEYDGDGKKVAMWLFSQHPGEVISIGDLTSNRRPMDDIIHIYKKERPGQGRGVPVMHASMLNMKDFEGYQDAQLLRQKIAACYAAFVTDDEGDINDSQTESSVPEKFEPGMIEVLPAGKSITMANPPGVGTEYKDYAASTLQGIAVGNDVTYEGMTGDLSRVNFSSARMGWLEFQRSIKTWQTNVFIPLFCDRVWNWFMEAMELKGVVKKANSDKIITSWTSPRREMIDPVAETKALSAQVRNGFVPWSEAVRSTGQDPDQVFQQLVADKKKFDDAGLKLECDIRWDPGKQLAEEDGGEPKDKPDPE